MLLVRNIEESWRYVLKQKMEDVRAKMSFVRRAQAKVVIRMRNILRRMRKRCVE